MANNSRTIPTRIGSMVTHFQARDIAISANSLGTLFFYKQQLRGSSQHLLEIIPYRVERGRLPTCDVNSHGIKRNQRGLQSWKRRNCRCEQSWLERSWKVQLSGRKARKGMMVWECFIPRLCNLLASRRCCVPHYRLLYDFSSTPSTFRHTYTVRQYCTVY